MQRFVRATREVINIGNAGTRRRVAFSSEDAIVQILLADVVDLAHRGRCMRSRGHNVAASIKAEGAGVVVIAVKRSSSVIALREIELTNVWDEAREFVLYEFQPRLLIATYHHDSRLGSAA